MKNVTILLAVVAMLVLSAPAFAQTHSWTGGGDGSSWNNGSNWGGGTEAGTVPGSTSQIYINGGTCTATNPVLINSSTSAVAKKLVVGIYGGNPAWLTLKDGGSLDNSGWEMRIGHSTGTAAPFSVFTQEGGNFKANLGLYIGSTSDSKARYVISGGSVGTSSAATGKLDMSDGIGEFIVDCTDDADGGGAVVVSLINTKGYLQNAASELEFKLDANGSACAITVAGNVELAGELVLTGARTATTPLVLMTYTGSLSTTFDTEPGGNWTIDYGTGSNSQVTATIPEPATMSLLVIGGIGVLIRRRRK